MSYDIEWSSAAVNRLSALAKLYPEAPELVVSAVYELATNPHPTNSSQLGTSTLRRLLLGYWLVTYEVAEEDHTIRVLAVSRSMAPR